MNKSEQSASNSGPAAAAADDHDEDSDSSFGDVSSPAPQRSVNTKQTSDEPSHSNSHSNSNSNSDSEDDIHAKLNVASSDSTISLVSSSSLSSLSLSSPTAGANDANDSLPVCDTFVSANPFAYKAFPPYTVPFSSRFSYSWVTSLVDYGRRTALTAYDLFELPKAMFSEHYSQILEDEWARYWNAEKDKKDSKKPFVPYLKCLVRAFYPRYFRTMMWMKVLILFLQILRPVVLQFLLQFVQQLETNSNTANNSSPADPSNEVKDVADDHWLSSKMLIGLLLCFSMSFVSLMLSQVYQYYYWYGVQAALSVRGATMCILFRKALRMNIAAKAHYPSGVVGAIATVDADNAMNFFWAPAFELLFSPLLVTFCLLGLVFLLGFWSTALGTVVLITSLALGGRLASEMSSLQDDVMKTSDRRVQKTAELLNTMRTVKLYSYEPYFASDILHTRTEQLNYLLKVNTIGVINRTLSLVTPLLVSLTSFAFHVLVLGYTLDTSTAFVSLMLFVQMREPLARLPDAVNYGVRSYIADQRIQAFLSIDDADEYLIKTDSAQASSSSAATATPSGAGSPSASEFSKDIVIKNAFFQWTAYELTVPASSKTESSEDKKHALRKRDWKAFFRSKTTRKDRKSYTAINATGTESNKRQKGSGYTAVSISLTDDDAEHTDGEHEHEDEHEAQLEDDEKKQQKNQIEMQHLSMQVHSDEADKGADAQCSASTDKDVDVARSPLPTTSLALFARFGIAALYDIQLRVPFGSLILVCGNVGSGKSSLISAMLGEMHLQSGSVYMPKRVAYTAQVSWLQSNTVRANILNGLPLDTERYEATVHACALAPDIERMPYGDLTLLGESGINLSGGQKARLSLARAVYSDADVFLFDEPLSAVDAKVALEIWDHCFSNASGLLRGKTRIIATHQIQFAQSDDVDEIWLMENGRIKERGDFRHLKAKGIDFAAIVQQHRDQAGKQFGSADQMKKFEEMKKCESAEINSNEQQPAEMDGQNLPDKECNGKEKKLPTLSSQALSTVSAANGVHPFDRSNSLTSLSRAAVVAESAPVPPRSDSFTNACTSTSSTSNSHSNSDSNVADLKEHEESGAVKRRIYSDYFLADTSIFTWIFISILVVASQFFASWSEFWLAAWTASSTQQNQSNNNAGNIDVSCSNTTSSAVHALGFGASSVLVQNCLSLSNMGLSSAALLAHSKFYSPLASTNFTNSSCPDVSDTDSSNSLHSSSYFVVVYAGLVCLSGLLFFLRTYSLSRASHRSSSVLFDRLFFGVISSPQYFFESTPSGRILSRMAKDTEQCDQSLPGVVQDVFAGCVQVLGVIVSVSIISYLAIIPFAIVTAMYFYIQSRYLPSSRSLKRMETSSRSPIYSHFQETINGLQQIRAFSAFNSVERTVTELYARVDYNTRIYLNSFAVNRWLGFRLESVGAAVVFFSSSLSFLLYKQLGSGLIGLSISMALSMSATLNWMCRQISELEVQLNAVERISEYARLESELSVLPKDVELQHAEQRKNQQLSMHQLAKSEPPAFMLNIKQWKSAGIPHDWPTHGQVIFDDVSVAYRPTLPPALANVSATILPGEKIGIVGRTGAGKSTFTLALFRLMEASHGRIVIDGIDISQVPLHILRSRLAIIPQDPFLFRGSLRDNLDPLHTTTEPHIWSVLTRLECADFVSKAGGLELTIHGNNDAVFSVGQRQLLCLARAVLRKSKIMVLDEATASLDYSTDMLMKRLLAQELQGCTVITIAHRLSTVLDAHRIMVMDSGRLREFDEPAKLLVNDRGLLSVLLRDTHAAADALH